MKKIEIYKEDELKLSMLVDGYTMTSCNNSVNITYKVDDVEASWSIPFNKGYKLMIDL